MGKLGHAPGSIVAAVNAFPCFQATSSEFVEAVCKKMTTHLYESGDVISGINADEDPFERGMYLLLEGSAVLDTPSGSQPFAPGSGFGEAVMLGLGSCYPGK